MPLAFGEYPYDPAEKFSLDDLSTAARLRQSHPKTRRGDSMIFDQCPHTPACSTVAVCIEEIAWYLRHKHEIAQGKGL